MKHFLITRFLLITIAIVFHHTASATPISGKVADAETGEAIIGATIYNASSKIEANPTDG